MNILIGTEKQIAWAEALKPGVDSAIDSAIANISRACKTDVDAADRDWFLQQVDFLNRVKNNSDATVIIDGRQKSAANWEQLSAAVLDAPAQPRGVWLKRWTGSDAECTGISNV